MKLRNVKGRSVYADTNRCKEKHNLLASAFITVLLVLCVVLVLGIATANRDENGLLTINGYTVVSVSSSSMDPTFRKGDLLVLKSLTKEEVVSLSEGDVITFRSAEDINGDGMAGELNTHRITIHDEEWGCFVTKGDNDVTNPTEDRYPVFYDDVVALYTGMRLPAVGAVFTFLKMPWGFFLCILLPLILFFLSAVWETVTVLFLGESDNDEEVEKA